MILNKFLRFIIRVKIHISCTINFADFRKHLARFATPLTAQANSLRTKETLVDAPQNVVGKT